MTKREIVLAVALLSVGLGCLFLSVQAPIPLAMDWMMGLMHMIPVLFVCLLVVGAVLLIWRALNRPFGTCDRCDQSLKKDWHYCPNCGKEVNRTIMQEEK
ncbi:hypothetical protein [Novibacillus thermophilus]|uniref:Zinc-ribbon domain-containing protein n=1 Tax=Novibacillus thermophilus TaxID=1471761 RepID=A0A1U9K6S0_9BACL|nr:hypothetical protein [Novibacillus thermophilus]AQS55722.1 hypothetical protein B0W44_07875 [Novibacillus thermophilus]